MSQQINLFNPALHNTGKGLSVLNMLQGLGAVLFCCMLFYAYSVYQNSVLQRRFEADKQSMLAEQARLLELAAEFARQRSGLTLEQELQKVQTEVLAQRFIIETLKSGVIGNTDGYSDYMRAFATQVLNGLWLTGFNIDAEAKQMSISGAALSGDLVPGYIMRLNNEKVLRGKPFTSLHIHLPQVDEKSTLAKPYLNFVLQSGGAIEAEK